MSPVTTIQKNDLSFAAVADDFVRLARAGKQPSIEAFAREFPELAEEIRIEFPMILLAERLNRKVVQESVRNRMPAKLGNYRITSEIGKGGMGRVYAAYHDALKRDVAIKVISVEGPKRVDAIRRFQREARAAGKLSHPNIVPVYDYGTQGDLVYLVMQRIRGLDLARVIEELSKNSDSTQTSQNMDWRMVAEIGSQVASAIGYAHEKGLIHRDIKPANLLMECNGQTWVADFGLVKSHEFDQSLSMTGDLIGTPRYMAPEQFRGCSDARSDIYGLGLTLYELASGRKAWEELSGQEIITRRATLDLVPLARLNPAVPPALSDVIMKCCSFKPEDRYQSAKELHYVLNRYLHGHKVGDRRKSRNGERTIMKRWPIVLARGIATSIGMGVLGWALLVATQKKSPYKDPVAALAALQDAKVRNEFVKELPAMIEQMVTSEDPKFRNVIGNLAEEAMVKTVDDLDLPEEQKGKMKHDVGQWVEGFKKGDVINPYAREVFQGVKGGILSGSQFHCIQKDLNQSGLSKVEKFDGQQWLMLLRQGILEKRVQQEAIDRLIAKLHELESDSSVHEQEGSKERGPLTDDGLRAFLLMVETEITAVGGRINMPIPTQPIAPQSVSAPPVTTQLPPQVANVVENALKDKRLQKNGGNSSQISEVVEEALKNPDVSDYLKKMTESGKLRPPMPSK